VDARTVTIILRLIHILAGIFWAGTAFLVAGFLVPTARARGREGGLFLQHLMLQRRLSDFLGVAMLLTVLSGVGMYIRLAVASHGTWPRTPPGIAYGVGAVAAIAAGAAAAWQRSALASGPGDPRRNSSQRWDGCRRGSASAPGSPQGFWRLRQARWRWAGISEQHLENIPQGFPRFRH
jgi:hypothetical protein